MFLVRVYIFKLIRTSTLKRNYIQVWSVEKISHIAQILTLSTEFTWKRLSITLSVVITSVCPHISRTFQQCTPGNNHINIYAVQASIKNCVFQVINNLTSLRNLLIKRVGMALTGVPAPKISRNLSHTNATPVENASVTDGFLPFTRESTQERNHINVRSVGSASVRVPTYTPTGEFTLERNHTSVRCVGRPLVGVSTCKATREVTLGRNHTSVRSVGSGSLAHQTIQTKREVNL